MSILHAHIPDFPISVEEKENPQLKSRPLLITQNQYARSPVLYLSQKAKAQGLHRGMRLEDALKRSPRAQVLEARFPLYKKAHLAIARQVYRYSPLHESSQLGSFFLDLKGTESLFGPKLVVSQKIRDEITAISQSAPSLGLASNKLVSSIAAKVMRPSELCDVLEGQEASFLSPLPTKLLPGIRRKTLFALANDLAVKRIGQIAEIPTHTLLQVYGKEGMRLKDLALGKDHSNLVAENRNFLYRFYELSPPLQNDARLCAAYRQLIEALTYKLRKSKQMAWRFILKATYIDGKTERKQVTLKEASDSNLLFWHEFKKAWPGFLKRRLQIKAIGFKLEKLCSAYSQISFWQDSKKQSITKCLDRIHKHWGKKSITWGNLV